MSFSRRFEWSISPRWSGVIGLAAVAVVVGGCALAMGFHVGYSPLRNYVSELGSAKNPGHHFFNGALLVGGALIVPFSWSLGSLLGGAHGRRAAFLVMVAGTFMVLTGLFPLSLPVAHFGCAAVLFAAAILATLFSGLGLRAGGGMGEGEVARARSVAGTMMLALFGFMLLMTAVGLAMTAMALRRVASGTPAAVLRELPHHQVIYLGGLGINPPAVQEWVFLLLAMGILLAGSLALLRKR